MNKNLILLVGAAGLTACAQNTAIVWDEATVGAKVSLNENPAKPVCVKAGYVGETLLVVPPKEPLHSITDLVRTKNVHRGEALSVYSDFSFGNSNVGPISTSNLPSTQVHHTLASGKAAVLYVDGHGKKRSQ